MDRSATSLNPSPATLDDFQSCPPEALTYIQACECGGWHLNLWRWDDTNDRVNVAFKCRSWRHEGACRLWKGAQDFVRCKEAIEKWDYWCHVVLTFRPVVGVTPAMLFKDGIRRWSKLRKRVERQYERMKYIQTWEVHRSGMPHVHLAISNVKLWETSLSTPRKNWEKTLQEHAVACGFGEIGWVEPIRSKHAMAGYLTKLSRELTGTGVKLQVPTNAPKHFRRLRSSRSLLPPVHRGIEFTGVLKFTPCEKTGKLYLSLQE